MTEGAADIAPDRTQVREDKQLCHGAFEPLS